MQNRRANIPMREKKQRGPGSGSDVQIYTVKRFCAASDCNNEISGHTGQYCCQACYQRDYYRRHKKKIAKQRAARSVKRMLSPKSVEIRPATPISSKKKPVPATIPDTKKQNHEEPVSTDMLSVSEAAKRLKVCRQTLYNLEGPSVSCTLLRGCHSFAGATCSPCSTLPRRAANRSPGQIKR